MRVRPSGSREFWHELVRTVTRLERLEGKAQGLCHPLFAFTKGSRR